jgi:hypothetical protein
MLGSAQQETVRSGRSSTPLGLHGAWVPARTLAPMIWVMVLLCAMVVSTAVTGAADRGRRQWARTPARAIGGDGPRHSRGLLGRRPARRVSARRLRRATR